MARRPGGALWLCAAPWQSCDSAGDSASTSSCSFFLPEEPSSPWFRSEEQHQEWCKAHKQGRVVPARELGAGIAAPGPGEVTPGSPKRAGSQQHPAALSSVQDGHHRAWSRVSTKTGKNGIYWVKTPPVGCGHERAPTGGCCVGMEAPGDGGSAQGELWTQSWALPCVCLEEFKVGMDGWIDRRTDH